MKRQDRETHNVDTPELSASASPVSSKWEADMDAFNNRWQNAQRMVSIDDAFTLHVALGSKISYKAPTHLFGSKVNIIPYHDGDDAKAVDGTQAGRGDIEISRYFSPKEIGFAIKHHRPEHRVLTPDMTDKEMKEHLKLQDTHIELVVGVERKGKPGVITLNNPQNYQGGRFGDSSYPMIFVKPVYPHYLPNDLKTAFRDNIRTMMVGFNAVSKFPRDYNGGDPLAANTVEKLKEHVRQMVLAIAGDQTASDTAKSWFSLPENMIYCAELAHVSASAGVHFPLNESTMVPLVGQDVWDNLRKQIEQHNQGEETPFVRLNENKLSRLVTLNVASEDLLPLPQYAQEANQLNENPKLAFEPMTMADIVHYALSVQVPRETIGENIALVQASILKKMTPGLLETMGMDSLPSTDPRRQAVENLINKIIEVVGRQYDDYNSFQAALEPYLEQARNMTGPRPGNETGKGLFVPPSLLHLIAQGEHTGGLLGLEYVGHGLHFSLLRKKRG